MYMQPLKKRIQSLLDEVMQAKQALQFDGLNENLAVLDEQLNQPEIWNNPDHAQVWLSKQLLYGKPFSRGKH